MSEGTLYELFRLRRGDDVALVTPSERLTVDELLQRAEQLRRTRRPGEPPRIIYSSDLVAFVVGLIALDGVATAFAVASREGEIPAEWVSVVLDRTFEAGDSTRWILATSGTTGEPKCVVHSIASLSSTTKRDLEKGSSVRWGLLYDPARFAGLQVVLQALIGGGALVVPPGPDLHTAMDFMIAERVTALSATPSQWRNILMVPGSEELPLGQVTLGGEIADQTVLDALSSVYPDARVVHIYASTEAGVGFAVGDGRAGFPLAFLDSGAAVGVELKIAPDGNLLLKKGTPATFLFEDHRPPSTDDGYLDTGDRVQVRGDRVVFLGRTSGAINVGGNKIMPEEIESILLEHPSVAAARVYAKPNAVLGNLVAADLQLPPGEEETSTFRAEVLDFCRSRLERWQVPAVLRMVEGLDLSTSGKVERTPGHG